MRNLITFETLKHVLFELGKVINILSDWKGRLRWNSSFLNFDKSIVLNSNFVIDDLCNDLINWFGDDSFELETKEFQEANHKDILFDNWLISILGASNLKSVQTVIEFWKVLSYHNSIDKTRIKSLVNFYRKKRFRQFRDYYFELFTFYAFEINKIHNQFKVYEGRNELEGIIKLNGVECLVECRKLYFLKYDYLEMNSELIVKFQSLLERYGAGIVVCVEYKIVDKSSIDRIIKHSKQIIREWLNNQDELYKPHEIIFDDNIIVRIAFHSIGQYDHFKNSLSFGNYVLMQSHHAPLNDGTRRAYVRIELEQRTVATEDESTQRFIKAIDKKRKKRAGSKYEVRIYVFESENYGGFDRGLFIVTGFSDTVKNKIQEYLNEKSTSDIVILLLKESNKLDFPRVRRILIANSGGELIASELERINFEFN